MLVGIKNLLLSHIIKILTVLCLIRGQVAGYHALRVVGWGEEAGQRYWRLANSWGSAWGEEGHVRVRRGKDECQVQKLKFNQLINNS